jgi:hypothetical protein
MLIPKNSSGTVTAADISDSTAAGRSLLTAEDAAAQRTAMGLGEFSGTNTGDETAARIATLINATTEDTTALDADLLPMTETAASGALRRIRFANLAAYIVGVGRTLSGAWTFSSTTRPTSGGTGTPEANSLVTRADVETLSVSAIPTVLSLKDSFVGGGVAAGTIGDLGWSIAGAGAAWARRGSAGLLVPPATITSSLICGSLGFITGDYFGGPSGIVTRSTSSFVTLLTRVTLSAYTVTNKPPSWVFGFGASPSAGAIPNRIIPANSAGIAAIPPANFNWTAATSFAVGATVNGGGFRQVCTTAGTSSAVAPTWPTTHGGTVTEAGGPTWTNCGISGQAAFLFFVAGADPLVNIAVANSTVNIPLTNAVVNYDLKIQSTASGYLFSVNSETAVLVADTNSITGMPFFAVRNDTAQATAASLLQLKHFGFYSDNR